jgi:hypothetical protein
MNSSNAVFAKRSLIVTVAAGILAFLLFFILPHTWFSPALPFMFIFYFSCSMISYMILGKSLRSKFSRFVSVFMLVTAIKLLLYIAVMLLYVFINRKDAVPFLLNFFILYLVYTVFEVTQIVTLTKPSA